jgi:hypothetical protein
MLNALCARHHTLYVELKTTLGLVCQPKKGSLKGFSLSSSSMLAALTAAG